MLRCLKSGVVCAFHLVNVIARRAFILFSKQPFKVIAMTCCPDNVAVV